MLKALWFFTKLGLVIAALIWVANQDGAVNISVGSYVIEVDLGIALLSLIVLIIITAQLYRLWRSIVSVPTWWRKYSEARDQEKGYAALSNGLVAIASGEKKKALKLAKKTKRFIPDQPLAKLLYAQSSLINGEEQEAESAYLELIEDKSTSFLGVRGLLAQKLRDGNVDQAIQILNFADEKQPKTPWVMKKLFSLYIQNREWGKADDVLHRAYKAKIYKKDEFKSIKCSLLLARSDLANSSARFEQALSFAKDAYNIEPDWVPAILYYAQMRISNGNYKEAEKALEKGWKRTAHPDIAHAWVKLFKQKNNNSDDLDPVKKMNHVKWLKKTHPDNIHARVRFALSAMEAGLFGEARTELIELSEKAPTETVFLALADLEIKQFKDEKRSNAWLAKASTAHREAEWSCQNCSASLPSWAPVCHNCGEFNTVEWGERFFDTRQAKRLNANSPITFLEPPLD